MTKSEAAYRQAAPGSRRCDRCTMFIRADRNQRYDGNRCTLVDGSIGSADVCDHFSPTYGLKPQGQRR